LATDGESADDRTVGQGQAGAFFRKHGIPCD
jgi:hypothetical protein